VTKVQFGFLFYINVFQENLRPTKNEVCEGVVFAWVLSNVQTAVNRRGLNVSALHVQYDMRHS
jgi:hypothetical protein